MAGLIPSGPVVDLYAGVGLFGLSVAAIGRDEVILVEGDPVSGASLEQNAALFGPRVQVVRDSVESFLAAGPLRGNRPASTDTFIVDPPRTGLSKAALAGIIRLRPARVVYVSCDIATFARDTRALRARRRRSRPQRRVRKGFVLALVGRRFSAAAQNDKGGPKDRPLHLYLPVTIRSRRLTGS